jgi:hypothetical protein
MTPEGAAKDALEQALLGHFDVATVGVHYGPPPTDETRTRNVWIGGVVADEDTSSLAGPGGANTDESFRVEVFCDAQEYDDPSPAGAKKASDAVFQLVHGIRRAVRGQVAAGAMVVKQPDLYVWWGHVVAVSSSPGPEPYEDGGWVETVAVHVQFTARIRS